LPAIPQGKPCFARTGLAGQQDKGIVFAERCRVKNDGIAEIFDQQEARALPKHRQRFAEIKLREAFRGTNDACQELKLAWLPVSAEPHPFARGDAFIPLLDQAFEP
jgi:hypothetical protein